ncbi:MAG TPA: DUF4350 domain-containing protein [Candidatus Elarobacter sp.]
MKRDTLVAAAAVALIAIVAVLTAKPAEAPKYATHDSTDFSFGGYRAWYELLRREGVRVARFSRHHDTLPDARIDTLVMSFPEPPGPSYWDQSERDAVQLWIRGGGRLIDVGLTPSTGRHEDLSHESVLAKEVTPSNGPLSGPWVSLISRLYRRGPYRIVPQKGHRVDVLLRDRAGVLVARYRVGAGDVVTIASGALFENRALESGDAARLAVLAAQPRHTGGVVAFDEAIRGDLQVKPWTSALDVPERVGLAVLAFAGLLWLAYGAFGLGPRVRLRAPREPTSREFLDAIAALYRRARAREHARDALVAEARRNLERLPRTAPNLALGAQVTAAAEEPVPDDATLVSVARLARTAREETIRAGRNPSSTRRTAARGIGAGRRRW